LPTAHRSVRAAARSKKDHSTVGGPAIDPAIRRGILSALKRIERTHRVKVLLAVESGSRAWGFPSPDSDYDVRFLYAHPPNWYLALDQRRDVIEEPINSDLDINGWDIRKALQLLCRSNATLGEWLVSPIVYLQDRAATVLLRRLARNSINRKSASWHYLRLGQRQFEREIGNHVHIRLKKYFYALRPALALAWLRVNAGRALPMSLQELIRGLPLKAPLVDAIENLVVLKSATKEMGYGERAPVLDEFISAEFSRARSWLDADPQAPPPPYAAANAAFRQLLKLA
jgi:uncharacterized protein